MGAYRIRVGALATALLTVLSPPAFAADAVPKELADAAAYLNGVAIRPGEQLTLSVGADGALTLLARDAAQGQGVKVLPLSDSRVETVSNIPVAPITAKPGNLIATLRHPDDRFSLEVENGFDKPMIYEAYLVGRQGARMVVRQTTICPIKGRALNAELWNDPIEAIIIANVHATPGGDLTCSGDTGLQTVDAAPTNRCVGPAEGSPLSVTLVVDPATGRRREAEAVVTLTGSPTNPYPGMISVFPMQGAIVGTTPKLLIVIAMVEMKGKPLPRTASIVLLADGKEAARRPWRGYAENLANLEAETGPNKPVGFFGTIPFSLQDAAGAPDSAVRALFAAIGQGEARRLEVRIVGDDGTELGRGDFPALSSSLRDARLVSAALAAAEAKAALPEHCAEKQQAAN